MLKFFLDNGVGMNQETKDRIFDPFFTSNLGKSTGLGMYIVHNLVVDQLEGTIEINSEENQGTLVSIRFPK